MTNRTSKFTAKRKRNRGRNQLAVLVTNATATMVDDPETDLDHDAGNHSLSRHQLQTITANSRPMTRHELLEGRQYMVVPMVMLTEGVHAGSNGPLYYPAGELGKTPVTWNHKPVVVYHPTMNGQAISACEPAVISRRKVGLIMNTKYVPGDRTTPGRLKAEAWLEINRLKEVDDRILNALQKGQMVEVSTGLFTDNEQTDGEVKIANKKEKYEAIARNYRPDHLAILPDEKGACSIADGAGLMRNAAGDLGTFSQGSSADSGASVWASLTDLLKHTTATLPIDLDIPDDAPTVRDIYPTFCIFGCGGKIFRQGYKTTQDVVKLTGSPEEVEPTYTTRNTAVHNTKTHSGDGPMFNKKLFINSLIANVALQWEEKDREFLSGLEENHLQKLMPLPVSNKNPAESVDSGSDANDDYLKDAESAVKPKKGGQRTQGANNAKGDKKDDALNKTKPTKGAQDDDEDEDDTEGAGMNNNQAETPEQVLNSMPAAFRDMFAEGLRSYNQSRRKLVNEITANKACRFTKEQLAVKDMGELNALAALSRAGQPQQRSAPVTNFNFAGMGEVEADPTTNSGEDEEEALAIPVMNFEVKKA